MAVTTQDEKKSCFEAALNSTGFGKYNIAMLLSCCLVILGMYMDIFGFSIVMPAVACDMDLSTSQQGLLSAMPLIGVMLSSYAWGLCADTMGRRTTLVLAMPVA
ncbi:putative transporter svop-1 [Manduca sexta]|uniref:putative transporter svop-1 n=1 Tax=Manduca sexta TaxID=7130 RepID=UPI00188F25C3|nr:putative transporter svop-1 [Manduca sexta]